MDIARYESHTTGQMNTLGTRVILFFDKKVDITEKCRNRINSIYILYLYQYFASYYRRYRYERHSNLFIKLHDYLL